MSAKSGHDVRKTGPDGQVKPVFIILGKPGSGKTTLAAKLAKTLNAELISPSTAVEAALVEESDLSKEISEALTAGRELSTALVARAMEAQMKSEQAAFRGALLVTKMEDIPARIRANPLLRTRADTRSKSLCRICA